MVKRKQKAGVAVSTVGKLGVAPGQRFTKIGKRAPRIQSVGFDVFIAACGEVTWYVT